MNTLSIIIPIFNESNSIETVLKNVNHHARNLPLNVEIVVVNDGSTDNTLNILNSLNEQYTLCITLPINRGKGAAIIEGLKVASGEYVLIQDADFEYSPKDYPKLIFPITEFNADIVMGSRFLAPEFTSVHYFWHKIGNRLITSLFNFLNNTTFSDLYSGFLLFRKSLLNNVHLKCDKWDQQAEILSIICPRAKKIYDVSINYSGRSYGEGKKIRAIHILPVFITMIKIRLKRLFIRNPSLR